MSLINKAKKQFNNMQNDLSPADIRWLLKCIFESHNVWGSDIEQSVKTINKLKNKLKEIDDVINKT